MIQALEVHIDPKECSLTQEEPSALNMTKSSPSNPQADSNIYAKTPRH